jgi:multiple sugar transport system permease protein
MASTSVPIATTTRRRRSRQLNRILLAYALVAPVVIWRVVIAVYPFLHTIEQSFTNESPMNYGPIKWVGLRNYNNMFQDPTVTESLTFSAIFTVASTILQLIYALAIATLLNSRFKARSIVRAVNLLPWAMPTIVIATAGQWLFNQQFGMFDDIWARIFDGSRPIWLADNNLARLAVILLDVWKNAPWAAIILLAGLQNIPAELYESAKVDGASAWRTFISVVLPLLMPTLLTLTIFIATYRVLSFDIVYGLTQGGPGSSTSLLSYQVYKVAFSGLYYGYAAAIACFAFLIVLVISLVGYVFLRRSQNAF